MATFNVNRLMILHHKISLLIVVIIALLCMGAV